MVNTYKDTAPNDYKIAEELRLIRAILERMLMDNVSSELFNGYLTEKFRRD